MIEVRIHGYGGQGAVTLATLLNKAATNNGSHSQALPFFGVERRGAPVRAIVRISDAPIHVHSQRAVADLLVIMSDTLYDIANSDSVKPSCKYIINAISNNKQFNHKNCIVIDAMGVAKEYELGTQSAAVNVPLYAACCFALSIPKQIMADTIFEKWSGETGQKNVNAALSVFNSLEE